MHIKCNLSCHYLEYTIYDKHVMDLKVINRTNLEANCFNQSTTQHMQHQ